MSKQKYYAVKSGRQIGIFNTWPECQKQINGYSGALYKSFSCLREAEEYLYMDKIIVMDDSIIDEDSVIIYVEGNYCDNIKSCIYGVLILQGEKRRIEYEKLLDYPEEIKDEYGVIVATLKALEILYESKYLCKKITIFNNSDLLEDYYFGKLIEQNSNVNGLIKSFEKFNGVFEVEFRKFDTLKDKKDYEQVKLLINYLLDEKIECIIKEIEYHECYSHIINDFQTIKGLNISAKEYIDNINEVCNDFNIIARLKEGTNVNNDKHIIVYFSKNYLTSEIHLHTSKDGLTIDVKRGKNQELNYIIVKEIDEKFNIDMVEEKKYNYEGLNEQKIQAAMENLMLFDDDTDYQYKKNSLSSNMKHSVTIKNKVSGEKIHVYVYTNNKLEIRGIKYLLWEDVCYIIEKSIGVSLNDIIGRMNIGVDLNFQFDKVDSSHEELRKELGEELVDFLYSYDYDVILSVKCSFDAKVKIIDYGIYIDPLTKAFEGYFKKILLHLRIVKTEKEMNSSNWNFGSVFDDKYELKNDLHMWLKNDMILRQKQLDILSQMCELMWTLRNKINHSGPKGTITYNSYQLGLKKYNDIMKLLKDSFKLLF